MSFTESPFFFNYKLNRKHTNRTYRGGTSNENENLFTSNEKKFEDASVAHSLCLSERFSPILNMLQGGLSVMGVYEIRFCWIC